MTVKTKTIGLVILAATLVLAGRSQAQAQTDPGKRLFLDLNAGIQTLSPAVDAKSNSSVFGENADISTRQDIGTGPIFNVRLGYRTWRHLAVAFAFSGFEKSFSGAVTAGVPSTVVVGSPTTVHLQATGMTRRDLGYHLQATWAVPVSDKFELAFSAGPSLIHVQQPVVHIVAAGGGNVAVVVAKDTGWAKGGNAGVDAVYSFSDRYGAGMFVRYAGGSIDLPHVKGLAIRSLQAGAGIRLRF
jgi:hypothetical protein